MNQADLIVQIAVAEIGYLEKASNSQLDSKTANAGRANITKYWRDIAPSLQGQPWCLCFCVWCARLAGVLATVVPSIYSCTQLRNWARDRGLWIAKTATPKKGDFCIFEGTQSSGARGPVHVGLVEAVTASQVTTIEGNTSGASGVIANGGGVRRKTYNRTSSSIHGYFRPQYAAITVDAKSPVLMQGMKNTFVGEAQGHLNRHGVNPQLNVDNGFGPLTRAAVDWFRRLHGLPANGIIDVDLWIRLRAKAGAAATPTVKKGNKNEFVREIQRLINAAGYTPRLAEDGSFGALTEAGVKWFQKKEGIKVDGVVGEITWGRLRAPVSALPEEPPIEQPPANPPPLTKEQQWAVDNGLFKGDSNGYNWNGVAVRNKLAVVLYRFWEKYIK